jgi:hypothetical protein
MQQDRYCRNRGEELQAEDRFCANCGRPVQETAAVPTPEADVPVPPPPQGEDRPAPPQALHMPPGEAEPGRAHTAPRGPIWGMVAVFLVQWVLVTIQERPLDPPGKDLGDRIGYQIGAGGVHAFMAACVTGAIVAALGGVYLLINQKRGVTFGESVFNWPLVCVAFAIAAFIAFVPAFVSFIWNFLV